MKKLKMQKHRFLIKKIWFSLPLLAVLPLSSYSLTSCSSSNVAKTQFGEVQGTKDGLGIYSFKGIPYAKTPVGDLRFAPPVNPDHWKGTKDCTKWGEACIQDDVGTGWNIQPQGEDCLNLNVWTPSLTPDKPLPVYVYIYGGVFTIGASEQGVFDGSAMSYNQGHKNMVVVTINYRLHALGFMALRALQTQALNDLDQPLWYQPDGSISTNQTDTPVYTNGDWGILDQIKALQWIHKNIGNFGGDAGNVTIGGESAGSFSVSSLIVSPATDPKVQSDGKQLFQHAVMESGNLVGLGVISKEAKGRLDNPDYNSNDPIGELPGAIQICEDFMWQLLKFSDTTAGIKALRDVPTSWLTEWFKVHWDAGQSPTDHTLNLFPSYDGWALPFDKNDWASSARDAISSGNFRNVDVLWGYNTDEGYGFIPDGSVNENTFAGMVRNFLVNSDDVPIPYSSSDPDIYSLMPYKTALGYDANTNYVKAARNLIKYAAFAASSLEFVNKMMEAESSFGLPAKNFYTYNFDYLYWYPSTNYRNTDGAAHTAELPFVFGTEMQKANDKDKEMSQAMMTYWTDFAASGNVNSNNLPEWKQMSSGNTNDQQMHFQGGTLYNGNPYKAFSIGMGSMDTGPKTASNDSLVGYIETFYQDE